MLSLARSKRTVFALVAIFLTISLLSISRTGVYDKVPIPKLNGDTEKSDSPLPKPIYKPAPEKPPEIKDNFPRAANAKTSNDLPKIPDWNRPPKPHVREKTPLFIGFTRNWRLLQQVVVSYITAGWPPEDIYVVENTGVMNSNRDGKLTLQNPFFLDHKRLIKILGINVLITPTLLTFAQLQNFYTYTAVQKQWDQYFWAHMDTVMVSDEEWETDSYRGHKEEHQYVSAYLRALEVLRESMDPSYGPTGPLATRWFSYDRLALVRTQAFVDVGGWDTLIPFYMTDCDMHERLWMNNMSIEGAEAGKVWDLDTALDDLEILYHRGPLEESSKEKPSKKSPKYQEILHKLDDMQNAKGSREGGRNTWQASQKGGQGEPFYRDSEGFEKGIRMTMEFGRNIFEEKWGRGPCNLRDVGMVDSDAWRVVKDWEKPEVQKQARKDGERQAKEEAQREKEAKEKVVT